VDDNEKSLNAYLRRRWESLKTERSQWMKVWEDISRHLAPDMGRFRQESKAEAGRRRDKAILDNTATRAMRTLAAGLHAGLSSPSQPWLEFRVSDPNLRDQPEVKTWLVLARDAVLEVFARSNAYRAIHTLYEELSVFGTACAVIAEDFDTVIHLHVLTAGSYAIATDSRGQVNTLFREFSMTVEQVVDTFGEENCSDHVRNQYRMRNYDLEVVLLHAIEPRRPQDRKGRVGAHALPWREVYLEMSQGQDRVLRESGYARFNVLAPRWIVNGENVYGTSPGREALGDVKSLQHLQLRKSQAVDYQTKPPVQGPANLKGNNTALLPGGYSPIDAAGPGGEVKTVFEVRLDLADLTADIQDTRGRISRTFYEDLFRMVTDLDRSGITARQIAEQHSEKMMLMGPVLERVQNECLAPLAEMAFEMLLAADVLPTPPEALQDGQITVEFVSILAQAQRQAGAGAVDRWLATIGSLAPIMPETLDKVDPDAVVDEYAQMLAINPRLIRSGEELDGIRTARAQQAQQVQQAEQQAQSADTAKDIATAQAVAPEQTNTAQQLDIARFLGG